MSGTARLFALSLVVAGCGGIDDAPRVDASASDTTSAEGTATVESTDSATRAQRSSCTNAEAGYQVAFPAEWRTNDGSMIPACSLFDPDPIRIEPATEIPAEIAVAIHREPVPFNTASGDAPARRVVSRDSVVVAGRPAVRMTSESTGHGLWPAGMRSYSYFVDLDGATLIAATHDVGDLGFETKRRVLDTMMQSLRFMAR